MSVKVYVFQQIAVNMGHWIFKKWDKSMDWIPLAQDRDRRLELVKVSTNTWVL
jgi:hypothetical protein